MSRRPLQYEEGVEIIQGAFEQLRRNLKEHEGFFNSTRYVTIYTKFRNHEIGVFSTYRKIFVDYMSSVVWPCLEDKHGELLLRVFVRRWRNTTIMTILLSHYFKRLKRHFGSEFDDLCLYGFKCFRNRVYEKLRKRVRAAIIQMIDEERDGKKIDRLLLKKVVGVLVKIGENAVPESPNFDVKDLETHLREKTSAYYSRRALKWILECSCSEYIRIVEECLKNEKERVSKCLYPIAEENLVKRVEHELLVVHHKQLLEKRGSGFLSLLAAGSFEDPSKMFRIYKKLPESLELLAHIFRDYVREEGISVTRQAEEAAMANNGVVQEQILVRKLIELLDRFKGYVTTCFEDHSLFRKAMNEAFEVVCNKTVAETSMPEIFATFFDTTLQKKKKKKKKIDEHAEETIRIQKAVTIFDYVNEKDFFIEIYKRMLGRRLLTFDQNPNNVRQELRRAFREKLTPTMEGMVKDLIRAEKDHISFMEYLGDNPDLEPEFDFSAAILTFKFWPRYKPLLDMNLPLEMATCLQSYAIFYYSKTNRKLTWIYSLGRCQLLGRFEKNWIELIVSTHQAAVLLLFNESDQLRFSDIASQLNLSSEDLSPLLHSLCLNKYKILTKNGDTNTISQSDTFKINDKFLKRTREIHVPQPMLAEECKRERHKVIEDVNRDGRYVIDTAIVRIMKRRKVVEFRELVSECVDQLKQKFKPDIKTIKIRIESLMTRDFLERDPMNPNILRYLP